VPSTVKSVGYTLETATPITLADPRLLGGTVHSKTDVYEAAGLAANDIIQMVSVKEGEVVVGMLLGFDALGTGATLDVGDGGDVDRYMDGVVASAAAVARLGEAGTPGGGTYIAVPPDGMGYQYTADDTIDVKIATVSGTATGTIKLTVFYIPMGG